MAPLPGTLRAPRVLGRGEKYGQLCSAVNSRARWTRPHPSWGPCVQSTKVGVGPAPLPWAPLPYPDGLAPGGAGVEGSFVGPESHCGVSASPRGHQEMGLGTQALQMHSSSSQCRAAHQKTLCASFQATKFGSQASQKVPEEAFALALWGF